MPTRIIQIDAFAEKAFTGNPAAVCLLTEQAGAEWMQAVAGEMNLSETAFLRPLDDAYELRWFTPKFEVDLCGHATLASAHALWTEDAVPSDQTIRFRTRSGTLSASRVGELIELDFPSTPPQACLPCDGLLEALDLRGRPTFVGQTPFDSFVVLDSEDALRSLKPDFSALALIRARGILVTSPSSDPEFDFISRFFAPAAGINEDPVTGSAHCCLAPYWAGQLGKSVMTGFQASERGGVVRVRCEGERVILGGKAVTVMRGELL